MVGENMSINGVVILIIDNRISLMRVKDSFYYFVLFQPSREQEDGFVYFELCRPFLERFLVGTHSSRCWNWETLHNRLKGGFRALPGDVSTAQPLVICQPTSLHWYIVVCIWVGTHGQMCSLHGSPAGWCQNNSLITVLKFWRICFWLYNTKL